MLVIVNDFTQLCAVFTEFNYDALHKNKQLGAPTVPSALIKCQFCYWSYQVIHVILCH
jgi:hypothetical protein